MCKCDFGQAVTQALGSACCQSGLQALGSNSSYVSSRNTRNIAGSADIDQCMKLDAPNAPRWDYAVGYCDDDCRKIFFIEIHSYKIGDLRKKKQWLDAFLQGQGKPLRQWASHSQVAYYWIPTQGAPSKNTPQYRQLRRLGFRIASQVNLQCP